MTLSPTKKVYKKKGIEKENKNMIDMNVCIYLYETKQLQRKNMPFIYIYYIKTTFNKEIELKITISNYSTFLHNSYKVKVLPIEVYK